MGQKRRTAEMTPSAQQDDQNVGDVADHVDEVHSEKKKATVASPRLHILNELNEAIAHMEKAFTLYPETAMAPYPKDKLDDVFKTLGEAAQAWKKSLTQDTLSTVTTLLL